MKVRLRAARTSLPIGLRRFDGDVGEIVEVLEPFEGNPQYQRVVVRWGEDERVVAVAHLEEVDDDDAGRPA